MVGFDRLFDDNEIVLNSFFEWWMDDALCFLLPCCWK